MQECFAAVCPVTHLSALRIEDAKNAPEPTSWDVAKERLPRPWSAYSDVIIAIGAHDAMPPSPTPTEDIENVLKDTFALIENSEPLKSTQIIYRTSPMVGESRYWVEGE